MISRLCATFAIAMVISITAVAQPPPSIEGVWKITEQTINGRTLRGDKLGVGFHIYTKGYFAVVRESGEPPRPALGEVSSETTTSQLIAAWGPFVSQLGTYRISGNQLIGRVLVAKNPENANRGEGIQTFAINGSTLTLETTGVQTSRSIQLKFVRVE